MTSILNRYYDWACNSPITELSGWPLDKAKSRFTAITAVSAVLFVAAVAVTAIALAALSHLMLAIAIPVAILSLISFAVHLRGICLVNNRLAHLHQDDILDGDIRHKISSAFDLSTRPYDFEKKTHPELADDQTYNSVIELLNKIHDEIVALPDSYYGKQLLLERCKDKVKSINTYRELAKS